MKIIPMNDGFLAVVDDADYELVSTHRWRVQYTENDGEMAVTRIDDVYMPMHRLLLGLTDERDQVIHVNGSRLDNRRSNLAVVRGDRQGSPCSVEPGLLRTWEAFVERAYDLLGDLADELPHRMNCHRLTNQQVLYYVNWTLGMSHAAIAAACGVTLDTVSSALWRLRQKWPDLFRFPPLGHVIQYEPFTHDPFVVQQF